MNVHFQFVDPAMSMKEERETKPAHDAKPDISVSKVRLLTTSE